MIFLRSFLFNILFFCWAMISAVIFAPYFITSPAASRTAGRPWAKGALWLARVVCGIRYEVRGAEHIARQPVIYASKHQSAWDTIIFLCLLHHPAYILKESLLRIPLWGWYLWRMEMIAIDRSAGASTIKKIVRDAKAVMEKGRPVVIFPEGTRKRPRAPLDYQPGILALYKQLNVPVVPVALNSGIFWGRDAFLKRPGTVVIEFLPAIEPGLDKKVFSARLTEAIENKTGLLLQEAEKSL
ncbi:MAG: lysophospholipid acyltransferase family protein [Alphaproteobacteria bacterium]